jgi:hypothetical protein
MSDGSLLSKRRGSLPNLFPRQTRGRSTPVDGRHAAPFAHQKNYLSFHGLKLPCRGFLKPRGNVQAAGRPLCSVAGADMQNTHPLKSLELGLAWLFVGGVAWWGSIPAKRLVLSPADPGPWLVPRVAASVLLLAAIGELAWECWQRMRHRGPAVSGESYFSTPDLRQWGTLFLIAVYVALQPFTGFVVATLLFVPAFLFWQSSRWRWWSALIVTVVLLVYVYVLFDRVLTIPLPEGRWPGLF